MSPIFLVFEYQNWIKAKAYACHSHSNIRFIYPFYFIFSKNGLYSVHVFLPSFSAINTCRAQTKVKDPNKILEERHHQVKIIIDIWYWSVATEHSKTRHAGAGGKDPCLRCRGRIHTQWASSVVGRANEFIRHSMHIHIGCPDARVSCVAEDSKIHSC